VSVYATAWAWRQPVAGSAKLILLKLADQANDEGTCFPSQKTIGRDTGLGKTAVKDNLRKLRDGGLIEAVERHVDGRQTSNGYRLLGGGRIPTPGGRVADPSGGRPGDPLEPSVGTGPSLRSGAPDPIWDTLVDLLGEAPRTRSERSKWNKAAKELREADVTPEEIRTAVAAYGRHPTFKECALTPLAIVTNLSTLLAWAKPAQASRAEDIRQRMARRGIE
jgi:biotin operon repressor